MRTTPTPTTAILAGIWLGLGLRFFSDEFLLPNPSAWRPGLAFLLFSVVFFLLPVKLFVEGYDSKRGWGFGFSRDYWRAAPHFFLRSVFWFVGFAATAAILSLTEK